MRRPLVRPRRGAPDAAYTRGVASVGERLRAEDLERMRRMTLDERLAEAFALGDQAIEICASVNGISRDEARRLLERSAQAGRRASRVMRAGLE